MASFRDNNFNEKQIRGIDLCVKSAIKKFPFIKGWEFDKDFENYKSNLYIDLIVDFDLAAKFYNTKLSSLYSDRKRPLKSSLILTFMELNPLKPFESEEYQNYLILSHNKTKEITNFIDNMYQYLPDNLSIFYKLDEIKSENYKVRLMVNEFVDITVPQRT